MATPNVRLAAEAVLRRYAHNRGAGKTTILRDGLLKRDAEGNTVVADVVLLQNSDRVAFGPDFLQRNATVKFTSLKSPHLFNDLRGSNAPLMLDHTAIEYLLDGLLSVIDDLEGEVSERSDDVDELAETLRCYEEDNRDLEDEIDRLNAEIEALDHEAQQ